MLISDALKQLYASSGSAVILHTLSLKHYAWQTPYYLVSDWADLTATLEDDTEVVFQKFAFNIKGPDINEEGGVTLAITIDNVSKEITDALMLVVNDPNQVPVEIVYRIYLSTDTSAPQNLPPLKLYLRNVKIDTMKITGVAEMVNFQNRKFPTVKYNKRFRSLHDAV